MLRKCWANVHQRAPAVTVSIIRSCSLVGESRARATVLKPFAVGNSRNPAHPDPVGDGTGGHKRSPALLTATRPRHLRQHLALFYPASLASTGARPQGKRCNERKCEARNLRAPAVMKPILPALPSGGYPRTLGPGVDTRPGLSSLAWGWVVWDAPTPVLWQSVFLVC
jgi:hypothetical protein